MQCVVITSARIPILTIPYISTCSKLAMQFITEGKLVMKLDLTQAYK